MIKNYQNLKKSGIFKKQMSNLKNLKIWKIKNCEKMKIGNNRKIFLKIYKLAKTVNLKQFKKH